MIITIEWEYILVLMILLAIVNNSWSSSVLLLMLICTSCTPSYFYEKKFAIEINHKPHEYKQGDYNFHRSAK